LLRSSKTINHKRTSGREPRERLNDIMCDITLDNFDAKYHEINHSLHKANFVAIDTEFTGLHLDSAQPRYFSKQSRKGN
jgi:hypothetical protein